MKRFFLTLLVALAACQQVGPPTAPAEPPPETPPAEVPAPPPPTVPNALWSDPATWGGAVPGAGENVTIPVGKNVLLDVNPPELGSLSIRGALVFDAQDLSLSARWIEVTGSLEVGSFERPFSHKAVITLTGPDENVMKMGGKFLVAMSGGVVQLHGEPRTSWARLAKTLEKGGTVLELDTAPDWRVGDAVVVASTDFDYRQAEVFEVVGVSGTKVSLDKPTAYSHWSGRETYGGKTVEMRAEVGLLSRNVRVQGDAASEVDGFGGHFMAMGGALFVSGTELYRMGQRFKMGRYPVHWHMLGDASRGQFVVGSSVHHSFNRCVTVHGSNGVLVQDNVAFDAPGHCFFLEDGAETDNVFDHNLGLSIYKPASEHALLPSDRDFRGPAVYWLTNPANRLTDNVAAGSEGSGFWLALPEHPTGLSKTAAVWPRYTPLILFANNVAHSANSDGLHVDGGPGEDGTVGTSFYRPSETPNAVENGRNTSQPVTAEFTGFTAYKNRNRGVWLRGAHHVLTDARLADNAVGATFASQDTSVTDSLFVGETANRGTPPPWQVEDGKVGADGRSLPKPWEPDFPVRGFEFYDGKVSAEASHFARFVPNSRRQASALSYLRFTAFSVDPRNEAGGLSFEGDGTKRVYLELDQSAMPPGDPTKGSRDGYRSAVFLDRDGSVTGTPERYVVVDNPFLLTDKCSARAEWTAWVCDETYAALSVNLDEDRVSVSLSRDDGVTHTLFGTGASPSKHFRTLLLPEREYTLGFAGARPATFRVVLQQGAGRALRLKIPFADALPVVSRYGRELSSTVDLAALETASKPSYYYDGDAETLHVKMITADDYDQLEVKNGGPPPPVTGSGTGLTGAYFNSRDFSGEAVTRLDPVINFEWPGSPVAGVRADDFTVRWTGAVQATEAGEYTFTTVTDDGVRLEVCGQVLFNDTTYHGPQPNSGKLTLSAGQTCPVSLELFDGSGGAFAQLWWQYGPYTKHLVPQRQLYPK